MRIGCDVIPFVVAHGSVLADVRTYSATRKTFGCSPMWLGGSCNLYHLRRCILVLNNVNSPLAVNKK